jgi:pimeloyl-ACP methyl ester carboxylesterase
MAQSKVSRGEVNRASTKNARDHVDDLRGASRLAIDATRGVTELVEAVHTTIARGPASLGRPFAAPAELTSRLVYGTIRGVMQIVGSTLDVALAQLTPLLGSSVPGVEREAVLAALNGVLGDYLSEAHNPLAIEMQLRHGGEPLELTHPALSDALPRATGKLLVLIHGLCATERRWTRDGHDHGAALARDLGYTPVHVRYNTGLHISTNGRLLAAQLERLAAAWPVPLDEIVLLGHSMGGLVARSACHAGEVAGQAWRARVRSLITLGSPHHGAPLERGVHELDLLLGISSYSAPFRSLGRIRSAGITDLRYGGVLDERQQRDDRFAQLEEPRRPLPLPAGVNCYAIAGTLATARATRPRGDGMVPVDSALGRHPSKALTLGFPESHCAIIPATGHLDLLSSHAVYATLHAWLSSQA